MLCVSVLPHVYCFTMSVMLSYVHALVAALLARSQYSEGPATGHLGTGFSWFPYVYKRMLRWFPRLQVATACFSCSPPDLNFLDPYFIFMYKKRKAVPLQVPRGFQEVKVPRLRSNGLGWW